MSRLVTFAGVQYTLPDINDVGWVEQVNAFFDSLAANAASLTGPTGPTGAAMNGWMIKTSAYNQVNRDQLLANTSGGAFTITLEPSPNAGDTVMFCDYAGTWPTNNLTIAANGNKIQSDADNLICNVTSTFTLVYTNSTIGWEVLATAGPTGPTGPANGPTGPTGPTGSSGGATGATGPTGAAGPALTVASSVSAAGSTQGTATSLTDNISIVTTCTAGQGVVIGANTAGGYWVVRNASGVDLLLYPPSGAQLEAAGTNNPLTVTSTDPIAIVMNTTTQGYNVA